MLIGFLNSGNLQKNQARSKPSPHLNLFAFFALGLQTQKPTKVTQEDPVETGSERFGFKTTQKINHS